MSLTLAELNKIQEPVHDEVYNGPTKYMGIDVAPYNHPTAIANEILGNLHHWIVIGLQLTAPMGKGKSVFATVIAHHLHTLFPAFNVVWAGPSDFKNINKFLESLPKFQPVIIIFDDITSALKQMSDNQIHTNFNALTRIRHIIDPVNSKTPIVVMTTGHYSKNLEKEFRNVLEYNGFLAWTNDEQTNMDAIAPKDTQARKELKKFVRIYRDISRGKVDEKTFGLRLPNGKVLEYKYDEPFRPACVVHGIEAKIILFDERDCCELCTKKRVLRMVPPEELYKKVESAWRGMGVKALRLACWRRGYYLALGRNLATASQFVEEKVFAEMTTDFDELVNYIYKVGKKSPPKQLYHKRKEEEAIIDELNESVVEVPVKEKINETSNPTDSS